MPYPAQVNRAGVIEAAAELIEREGVEGLSLGRVAGVLGVKAPSLYRHVEGKDGLIRGVVTLTLARLFGAYEVALAGAGGDPAGRFLALVGAHRRFALANPRNYVLAFTVTVAEQRADEVALERMVLPVQALMGEIVGAADSLAALRGALALVHGFVMLELNEQFRRRGDLTEAFEASMGAYLAGWKMKKGTHGNLPSQGRWRELGGTQEGTRG